MEKLLDDIRIIKMEPLPSDVLFEILIRNPEPVEVFLSLNPSLQDRLLRFRIERSLAALRSQNYPQFFEISIVRQWFIMRDLAALQDWYYGGDYVVKTAC